MRFLILLYLLLGLALPAAAMDVNGPLTRADLENLSADPSSAASGRIYLNTTSHKPEVRSNSAWLTILDTTSVISGQTLTGDTVSNYVDVTEQASAPSSPSSSTLRVYAKTDDKLYTLNSSGVETAVGSGSGEKNYLSKGTSTAAGWTSSDVTKITCTTTTSNLPDASVGTALAVTGQSGAAGTEYCFYNFDIDQADGSKVLKLVEDQLPVTAVASDFRLDVYSCTVAWSGTPATTCSGTATRLALTTDNSSGVTALPALTGTLTPPPTYSTPAYASAPHLQARIGLNGASTHQMNFAQVLTGPGTVVQSAAVGAWKSYTPVTGTDFIGSTTSPTFGTTTANLVTITRDGSYARFEWTYTQTAAGAAGSGTYEFKMPTGLTINTSVTGVAGSTGTAGNGYVGRLSGYSSSAAASRDYSVFVLDSQTIDFRDVAQAFSWSSPDGFNFGQTAVSFKMVVTVPINEWAGQGTVFLGQGVPAYYYGTGGTWGTSSTLTTAQGQGGVLGGTTTPTGTGFTYTLTPTTPIPAGATPVLEVSQDGIHFSPTGAVAGGNLIENLHNDGTNYIGAVAYLDTSGRIAVTFGKYAYGSIGAWVNTWYWRVFVGYPGQATGFAAATNTARGLMLDRKQYVMGTAYTHGTPSITSGTPTGWTLTRGTLVPYQTNDGTWRLKFTVAATFTSASTTSLALTFSGITSKNVNSFNQPFSAMWYGSGNVAIFEAYIGSNSNLFNIFGTAASTVNGVSFAGDIELDSKPTWAD